MKKKVEFVLLWLAVVTTCAVSAAQATGNTATDSDKAPEVKEESDIQESDARKWQFEVAPYLWWSGVKSTVKYGDIETSSDLSFLDALDHLKFGGLIHAEANTDRWGLISDVMYMKLGEATEKRIGGGLKLINIDVKADLEQTMFELGGFYRFQGERCAFDVLGGGRYFGFATDAKVGPLEISRDKDWVDPFVGGRFNIQLAKRLAFSVRGDVGGFGVGSDSTWNATALFRYRLKENMDLGIGYRHMDVEKSSDDGSYDAITSGPLFGMSIRF